MMLGMLERLRLLKGWRADLAGFTLGVLSAAALPPIYVIPVLLLSAPGLLALVDGARGPGSAAQRGFWFGLGHHMFGLYWITEAILLESARYWWLVPLAVPALSALLALFIAAPCAAAKFAAPGWPRVAMFGGAWVLADLARQFIGTGFPWNPWGSVWAMPGLAGDIMIQPAALIGTPGLTLATVLLASTPYIGRRAMAGAAVVVLLWAGSGWYRLREPDPAPTGMKAVLVQGNIAQGDKWDQETLLAGFDRQLALTRQGVAEAAGHPTVVIWPETSVAFLLQYDPSARAAVMQAAKPAVAALVGGLTFDAPPSRTTLDTNPPYNSLIALTPNSEIAGIYSKWHLVPFGEFAPSWVPFSIQVVPGRFGFGTGPRTLHLADVPAFGPLICYEAVYPGQVVDEADRPTWMVNITNDAWFGNSTGPRQHLEAARLRAVEEGLPLMRAANTGITVAFDARGHELARTVLNTATELTVDIPGARPATSFSRWGLVIPGLLSLVFVSLGLRRRA